MKFITTITILAASTFFSLVNAQYKKVYSYDKEQAGWAKVKTIGGTFGFIDKNKKVVVQPVYAKIGKFNEYKQGWALVKNISDGYGFIDNTGKEVVPATYTLEELKTKYNKK
ncbi:WG repeat-containing protein [Soonwooa sp.]|uniref:WG repeat-containing protein n=1 Tax=Soonwooa sp. TaxID=1938592 RepID=UPI0026040C0D|nr:WG repeat-containing protein [Soonwooa sp.]